jgi:hypothetical protein
VLYSGTTYTYLSDHHWSVTSNQAVFCCGASWHLSYNLVVYSCSLQ